MEFRRADSNDIPALASLLRQVLEVHAEGRPDLFRSGTRKYTNEELAALLADPCRPVFVAVANGEVKGYAFCIHEEERGSHVLYPIRTLYVDDLCVDENERGQGIGRALYEEVCRYARGAGFERITLNVWSFNAPAMAFYERMGMTPMKTTMEQKL